jgi:DnaJ family protein C protein 28
MDNELDKDRDELENEEHRIPPLSQWSSAMDDIIDEAVNEGFFDNLAGRGKPLDLRSNPFGQESELAFQLLKQNDYTLPWIEARSELLEIIAAFRLEIIGRWTEFRDEYRVAQSDLLKAGLESGWRQQLNDWQEKIGELNKRISNANLKLPGEKLEIFQLNLDVELQRANAHRDLR